MLSSLENIDRELFVFLNGMHNTFADWVMYYASEKWVWIPLYLFIALLLIRRYGVKSLYIILPVSLLILGTDQISVAIKNEIARYRPCHNLDLMQLVHKVENHCGGKFGFVSSHSTNAFGLFAYLGFMIDKRFKPLIIVLFFWACLQAYSRIYLGVHYPADVIGGAILGITIAFVLSKLLKWIYSKYNISYV